MLRQTYDPKVARELAVMKVIFPLIGLVICIAILGLYLWRLHHFERSVARIEAVWEEEVSRRGVTVITMAELSFSRTAPTGESLACRYQFEIGTPRDGFKVGDKLDIVPATGTCQRADIIGRSEQNP
ncbi:hypothetical protein [Rhizobium leguminosarum]|uniref:hypothetical protein n=1 Tax=Rhizobium leguminosarum TaxID=384 RepID=UPI0021BBBC40|nr:hypothetical protein [Rhizobium leguminosarum]